MTALQHNFGKDGTLASVTVPRYAFKFAAVTDYTLAALRENYLWFSRPADFNDVFELPTKVPKEFPKGELRAYLIANLSHHWPNLGLSLPNDLEALVDRILVEQPDLVADGFRKLQEARKQIIRICCMSMRYDDPLMWAHYAASFSGICLVFDFPCLIHDQPFFAIQVKYLEGAPCYDPVASSLRHHASSEPYSNLVENFAHDQLQFGVKLKEWAHEQELRLCKLDSNPKQPYPPEALVGVILGPRLSADCQQSIERAAMQGELSRTIERLLVDDENTILRVPNLVNEPVELKVSGVRNLAREMRSKAKAARDA